MFQKEKAKRVKPESERGKARVSVKPNRTSSMKHFFQAAKLGHHYKIEWSICSITFGMPSLFLWVLLD
jgi:hypothetical protein